MYRSASFTALACALALGLLSCGEPPQCPEAWQTESNQGRSCKPPKEVRAAAEEGLGTGIFGYVLVCRSESSEDDCSCTEDGLMDVENAAARFFPLSYIDLEGREGFLDVPVNPDATFMVELVPGFQYGEIGFVKVSIEGARAESFILADGQVSFARVYYAAC